MDSYMEEPPVKLSKRSGTTDSGRLYETKIVALLALRCIENPKIKHAWFASNVNYAYDFDDVVLYVVDENDRRTAYLMQLKHQEYPKNIPRKDFLYDSKAKKKSKIGEDFSLAKYQRSYLTIKDNMVNEVSDGLITSLIDADEINYVLYTNRPLGAIYDFVYVCHEDHVLLDTSNGGTNANVYGFNSEALDFDEDFLRHLRLFTQQAHASTLDDVIKKELKRIGNLDSTNKILKKYLDFIHTYVRCVINPSFDALTIDGVVAQLISFILDDYLVEFSLQSSSRAEFKLWNEIIEDKGLVLVETTEATKSFLESYVSNEIAQHCKLNNWNQENILLKTIGERSLTARCVYQTLWLQRKVPLLVETKSSSDFDRVQVALRLSHNISYSVIALASVINPASSNCLSNLNHLDEKHQKLILNHPITLQKRPGACLQNFINKSMYKLIKCKDIIQIITDEYNIGCVQGTALQFYVPRVLSKILFHPWSLSDSKFLLRGIGRTTFAKISKNVKSEVIFEDEPPPKCNYHELILVNENFFELVRSCADTKKLRTHQVVQLENLDEDVNCWVQPDELLDQSVCVINANPGMGKTELLNYVSLNTPPNYWVLKVNLNEHNEYYKKNAGKTALDHLNYFHQRSPNSELEEKVFLKFVKLKKVLVLLDGFDEISTTYKDEATSIATCLHASGYKIWVTTRPVTKAHLEDALDTISRTLKPLTVEDQKQFLRQYFEGLGQKEIVTKFVDKLLEAAAANLNDSDNRFTGLPLQTKLLADVFKSDLERIVKSNEFTFNDKFDLIFLYDSFLEEKTNIFCQKFGDIYRDMRTFLEKLQQLFALQTVFPPSMLEKLGVEGKLREYYEEDDRIIHFLQREGVVAVHQRQTNSEEMLDVNFVHRTFAEFLAAKWLYRWYKKEDVRHLIQYKFNEDNEFMYNVFDRYLAKGFPLHLSVINRNVNEALELIGLDRASSNLVDDGGRTVLHLIACYDLDYSSYYTSVVGMERILDVLSGDVEFDIKDQLLQYNALDYAIRSNTFAIANKLCQLSKNPQFSFYLYEKNSIFYQCNLYEYRYLFLLTLRYFSRSDLLEKRVQPNTSLEDYCGFLTNLVRYSDEYESDTVLELVRKTRSDDDIGFVAAFGGKEELRHLLETGVEVNKTDCGWCTALHYATIHNRLDNVELLISTADLNLQNFEGKSALHLALQNQNLTIAHRLIDEGVELNLKDWWGSSAFLYACEYGTADLVQKLLPQITDINCQNFNLESALHLSIKSQNFDISHILFDQGADVNLSDDFETTPLFYVCKSDLVNNISSDDVTVLIDLVKKISSTVADINFQDKNGTSALHIALWNGSYEIATALVDNGADVNLADNSGTTAFHYACHSDEIDFFQKIRPMVANVNLQNANRKTALHQALQFGSFRVAHELVDSGVDVNLTNLQDESALFLACKLGRIDFVKKILPIVADVNLGNVVGETSLHASIKNGFFDIALVLLEAGAVVTSDEFFCACRYGNGDVIKKCLTSLSDVNLRNQEDETALHVAMRYKNFDIAHILIDEGADVNLPDVSGTTPFLCACASNELSLLQKMLPTVTDVNSRNECGEHALDLTLQNQHFEIAHNLLDAGAHVYASTFLSACKFFDLTIIKKIMRMIPEVNTQNYEGETALHLTIQREDFKFAQELVDLGADVNIPDSLGYTPFLGACLFKQIDFLQKIIPLVSNINVQNKYGQNALHLAVQNQNYEIAHVFLDEGVDVNSSDNVGSTAFLYACKYAKCDLVKKMVGMVTDINLQNDKGDGALHRAFQNARSDVAQVLINEDVDINMVNRWNETALFYGLGHDQIDIARKIINPSIVNVQNTMGQTILHKAIKGENYVISHIIINNGADVNIRDTSGTTPFLYACQSGQLDIVKKMLPTVIDVNLQNYQGKHALHLAICNDVAHVLVDEGADVNLIDDTGTNAFLYACQFSQTELIKKMLSTVTDVNLQNKNDDAALHLLLRNQKYTIAHALLNKGADVNLVDASGTNPFIYACKLGQIDLVKKMLPTVTDVNLQNNAGDSALHLAISNYVAHVLVDIGADVNLVDASGSTALHYAREYNLVKKILPKVIDVNHRNNEGETALHKAVENGNFNIAMELVSKGADVNLKNTLGATPFFSACRKNMLHLVKEMLPKVANVNEDNTLHMVFRNRYCNMAHVLVDAGADVNLPDASGTNAFLYAYQFGNTNVISKIQPMIKDLNLKNGDGKCSLHLALENQYIDIVYSLIDMGADINIADTTNSTVFHYACAYGTLDLVQMMLKLPSIQINLQTIYGETALHLALKAKKFLIAHALVDEGADVNLSDVLGMTPFLSACTSCRIDLVKKMVPDAKVRNDALCIVLENRSLEIAHILIDEGADVTGTTAFFLACACGDVDLVNKMLPMVEDVNFRNNSGDTALHLVIRTEVLVKKMLAMGVDVNLRNQSGDGVLHLLLRNRKLNTARILIDVGADVNLPDASGTTVFLYTCQFCTIDVVKEVLAKVTDINFQNNEGKTALHLALQSQNCEVARALINEGAEINLTEESGTTAFLYACAYDNKLDLFTKILPSVEDINFQSIYGETALHLAIQAQNFEVADALIDHGADVNLCDVLGMTPFYYACKFKNIELVKNMIPMVADINKRTKDGESALHFVIREQAFNIAYVLVNAGADVNLVDDYGATPFISACTSNELDLVKKMLPMLVDVNMRNGYEETALLIVLQDRHFDIAHVLVDEGADVNMVDSSGNTSFLTACASDQIELVKKMLPMVGDVNLVVNEFGDSGLHTVLRIHAYEIANILIDEGADVNLADNSGTTPFHYVCLYGNIDLFAKMLPKVVDINLTSYTGETALHMALFARNFDVSHALVDKGADVNLRDNLGITAFFCACEVGIIDLVKKMIPIVTDINVKEKYGKTALHVLLRNGEYDIAHILIDAGADVNVTDADGMSPFILACTSAKIVLVKKMIPLIANINLQDKCGQGALHSALRNRCFNIAHILVDEGADVNLVDNSGTTPFYLACACNKHDLIKKMLASQHVRYGDNAFQALLRNRNFQMALLLLNVSLDANAFLYAYQFGNASIIDKIRPMVENVNFQNVEGQTPLHLALQHQNNVTIEHLIENGADVNISDSSGATAFHYACAYTEINLIKKMLHLVTDINSSTKYGETALHLALQARNFEVATFLVEIGADVNLLDALGRTPFLWACRLSKTKIVEQMTSSIENVDLEDENSETALHIAISNCNFEIAEILVDRGADVNLPDARGLTAFFSGCTSNNLQLVKKMLPTVIDINIQNHYGDSILHTVLRNRQFTIANTLVDEGAEVNAIDSSGTTEFMHACAHSKLDLVEKILPKVRNIDFQNKSGESALHLSLINQNFKVAHALVDRGAEVNLADSSGSTALHRACVVGQTDLVKKIISKIVDINLIGEDRNTALHVALKHRNFKIAHVLITEGADVNLIDSLGATAFYYACTHSDVDLVKKIMPKVTNINVQNENRETALISSIKNESFKVANVLLDEGADVNVVDSSGSTALHYACAFGKVDLVKQIVSETVNVNLLNRDNKCALHLAVKNRNAKLVRVLVDEGGADVNLIDSDYEYVNSKTGFFKHFFQRLWS